MKKEESLQLALSNYLRLQYKNVLFNVDLSGIRLSIGQARKAKKLRSGRSFPDMVIYHINSDYSALFLELKSKSPFKKDGSLLKNEHLEEQQNMLDRLNDEGYKACFIWSFEQGKRIIDEYLTKF